MARVLLVVLAMAGLSGCLRNRIDLCAMVPPHPECTFLDAGVIRPDAPTDAADAPVDALGDAPVGDAPVEDASADAGSDAP